MKTYTIERNLIKVKTGWFSSEHKPMWCLVEHGKHYIPSYGGGSSIDFDERCSSTVILYSDSKEYILEELDNFQGI